MLIKGVSAKEFEIINQIIEPYRYKYKFYCYGSRVKGGFRQLSDLDMLIISQDKILPEDVEELKESFDESLLPYVVNLAYDVDKRFYKLIEKDLTLI